MTVTVHVTLGYIICIIYYVYHLNFSAPGAGQRNTSQQQSGNTKKGKSIKFNGEFDFETSNARFDKEKIESELKSEIEKMKISSQDEEVGNGPFPFYMKFEKIQNRPKYHHSLKEHPMFSKITKFGCEML